ncbi:hypothetical protein D3C85_1608760 [compost metagenome]
MWKNMLSVHLLFIKNITKVAVNLADGLIKLLPIGMKHPGLLVQGLFVFSYCLLIMILMDSHKPGLKYTP